MRIPSSLAPPHKSANAFTMLELVVIIAVLGILAALAIPRLNRDLRQEAADNILSAIRYTQLMALMDDKTDPTDPHWQQGLWAIQFYGGSRAYYRIGSDRGHNGAISKSETAIDPSNGKHFYNSSGSFAAKADDESPNIFLAHNYGINDIRASGGCNKLIAFDHMGRPHSHLKSTPSGTVAGNDYATYMTRDCTLTFRFANRSIEELKIKIEKQTGHAFIVGQPDS